MALWRLRRVTIMVLMVVAAVAAIMAQKDRDSGIPPGMAPQTGTTGVSPVESEIANTLHFADIVVHTNGTATLSIAWPSTLLPTAATLDLFAATSLVNAVWVWQCAHYVAAGETNWIATVALPQTVSGANAPSAFFYVSNRETCADTMADSDGDGLPDVYELANGTNPYAPDYASAPKLTVGQSGDFTDIQSALVASTDYSIIELDPSVRHEITDSFGVELPQYPVMLTASNSYAVVRATGTAAFMLATNTTSRTLFKNMYLLLDAPGSFQVGFWCGGNLPWDGVPGAATFENIYMRMPNPNVQYRGWMFYRHCADMATIRSCTVNAAGATWAVGIDAYGSPPLAINGCSFVNFPPDGASIAGCGALLRTSGASDSGSEVTISRSIFDESFTNAWPLARFDSANPYFVTVSDCLTPRDLPTEYLPDISNSITVTNAALAWSGIPYPGSPSVALGIGSLMPIADDPLVDTDGDGLCDYDEAYERGTDPFNADSDNDGVDDRTEMTIDETDPTNPHSFKQRLAVAVTNTASFAHAVYTAWGYSETGWETNGLTAFLQGYGTNLYVDASSQGATHIKAFCDMNDDGEYDSAYDILLVRDIPPGAMAQVNFVFGDVDGDGVPDAQECVDGTDAYDPNNFRMSVTVKITNNDNVSTITNFLAYGFSATSWETNSIVSFADRANRTFSKFFTDVVTNGILYVKCYRDLNRNGVFDPGTDALVVRQVGGGYNNKEYTITIGDHDLDKIVDSIELVENTDPLDRNNYCFRMTSIVRDIFHTTNQLTVVAKFGDDVIYGPFTMTGGTWQASFGHLIATNRETIRIEFWDDANGNGILDANETKSSLSPAIIGHVTTDYKLLPYGGFDADQNGLLDSWEIQKGLNVIPDRSAYGDTDGDGLTDFLEYVAGTDPLMPDGSNTLLSVMSRSVDDRLADSSADDSMEIFINYAVNGYSHIFEPNMNCWVHDVDLTCCSMWNDNPALSACGPTQTTVTAISPRHVIYAAHFDYRTADHSFQNITTNILATMPTNQTYYFRGRSGQIYGRCLAGRKSIGGDIAIGLLDEALPTDDILPAYVLPTNFVDYIHDGKQIPFLTVDQQERATVRSCAGLNLLQVEEFTGLNMPIGDRPSFNKRVFIGGDSSSPKFFLVGNIPVLLGVLHKTSGHGSFVSQYFTKITKAMDELLPSSGYNLNVLDLSSFETISPYEED